VSEHVRVRVCWNGTQIPFRLPQFHDVHVLPEPGFPFGRKGLALAGAWRQLNADIATGMLVLDGDVAVDLIDLTAMVDAIRKEPEAVHVAPARLWKVSFAPARDWVWAHWADGEEPSQLLAREDIRRFSFCFTYLPRLLIERCIKAGMEKWTFPLVDRHVSLTAWESQRPAFDVRIVDGCNPKHLHF
jgi:hypothetical protein